MAAAREGRSLAARLRRRGAPPDLRPRTGPLTDAVVTEMTRSIPVFANAPEAFLDVTRLVVGRIVEQIAVLFVEVRLPTREEVNDLVEVCVPPTDQGVTLEDLLTVFGIAQERLWSELDRLVDDDELDDPRMAVELSQLGTSLITELSRGVTAAYLRGNRVWLQRRDAERALVRGILDVPPRLEEATRAAHALDLRVLGAWRCTVYEPVGEDTDVEALASVLDDARVTWGVRGALAVDGSGVVLVTQGDDPLPPPSGVRAGVGGQCEGAQGMRTSHEEAREALAVARRRGVDVLDADQARLGRVVLGSLTAMQLADDVLAPVDAEPEGRRELLMETLEAWLDEQGSATATAERLQLHVQSVRYRVKQLREVLGEALDDPDRRLQLHLAVRARELA